MKFIIAVLLLLIPSFAQIYAQQETAVRGKEQSDRLNFIIKPKYMVNINHFGRYTDYEKVKRVYDDGSDIDYERTITYFYTFRQPGKSEDGFTTLSISIDSMLYDFKSPDKTLTYNAMWDDVPPLNNPDYLTSVIPMSKEFKMTYSPYGEVVKLEGERLEDFRKMVVDIDDSLQKFYWERYSRDDVLSNIVDFQRGTIPMFPVNKDTSWNSKLNFLVDGVSIKGNATGKLTDVVNGGYFITLTADSLTASPQQVYKFGIDQLLPTINSGNSKAVYSMEINNGGLISIAQANIESEFEGQIRNAKFKEYVTSSKVWEIIERYQW